MKTIFNRVPLPFITSLFIIGFLLTVQPSITQASLASIDYDVSVKNADIIRNHYMEKASTLSPAKAGHMGLRLFRIYEDTIYTGLLLQGIHRTSKSLDRLVDSGLDSISLRERALQSNEKYKATTTKKKRRQKTFQRFPMYRLMATRILRHVARLNELDLWHEHHEAFRDLLYNYDFQPAFLDEEMIRAWGAQLANQVYWLYSLGVADYREAFITRVHEIYPATSDHELNENQFENKIYTMTHIVIAASDYYQETAPYNEHHIIIDYFRNNVDSILSRLKEDVIIEVGLSLLLVDETFPEIERIRSYINSKVDQKERMILSKKKKANFSQGEHRNIIAILLLDWQGCSDRPNQKDIINMRNRLPEELMIQL